MFPLPFVTVVTVTSDSPLPVPRCSTPVTGSPVIRTTTPFPHDSVDLPLHCTLLLHALRVVATATVFAPGPLVTLLAGFDPVDLPRFTLPLIRLPDSIVGLAGVHYDYTFGVTPHAGPGCPVTDLRHTRMIAGLIGQLLTGPLQPVAGNFCLRLLDTFRWLPTIIPDVYRSVRITGLHSGYGYAFTPT